MQLVYVLIMFDTAATLNKLKFEYILYSIETSLES